MRKTKKKPPSMPRFMLEITDSNRKRMEKKYGMEIPVDVDYIVPAETITHDPSFWEQYSSGSTLGQREIIS
jgi:hypothetical protein